MLKQESVNGVVKTVFTPLGIVLTIVSLLASALFTSAQKYYQYKNSDIESLKYIKEVQSDVLESVDMVHSNKIKRLLNHIGDIKTGKKPPAEIISNPSDQIRKISIELQRMMKNIFSKAKNVFREDDFEIGILYSFPQENDAWHFADNGQLEKGFTAEELTNATNSTFNNVLRQREPILFFNDKQQAINLGKYVADSDDVNDENGNICGSIICYRLNDLRIEGKTYIKCVMTIGTRGKKFLNSTSEYNTEKNVSRNIKSLIFANFEKDIATELCLLYIYELYKNKSH